MSEPGRPAAAGGTVYPPPAYAWYVAVVLTLAHIVSFLDRQVLALLVLGRNSREMADELGVSVHTVRSHVQNLLKALEVSSRVEAVSKALSERVI